MGRTPILLALLVLLAAAGVWAFWPAQSTGLPTSLPPAESEPPPAAAAPVESVGRSSEPAEPSPLPPASAIERRPVAAEVEGPTVSVRVVDRATGAAVPKAAVSWIPEDFDWRKLPEQEAAELAKLAANLEALQRRIGRSTEADEEGRCRVPAPGGRGGLALVARSGELYGMTHVRPEHTGEVALLVRPDRTLRVAVVDRHGGRIAGVRVVVEVLSPREGTRGPSRWPLGETDTDGRFERLHVQEMAGDAASSIVELCAEPLGQAGPTQRIDVTAPPSEVVLQMPPTGSVTIRLLEADGTPLDPRYLEQPRLAVASFDREPADASAKADGFNRSDAWVPIGPDGIARLDHVAFDRFLAAGLRTFDAAVFRGPTLENARVEHTIRMSAESMVLVGRLLGRDGAPLVERTLLVTCEYGRGMSSVACRTDAEGRLRACFEQVLKGDVAIRIGERESIFQRTDQGEKLAANLPPRTLQLGTNDLGDVPLVPVRVLLAGRVVRDAELPPGHMPQIDVERRRGRGWRQDLDLRPQWSDDRFEVRGVLADGESLRLCVREGPWQPVEPIECTVPATDLEVRLTSAGSVAATFLVDERVPAERLDLRLTRTEPPPRSDPRAEMLERFRFYGGPPARDGKLGREWTGLEEGTYRLAVTCPGVAEPIVQIAGLTVGSGPCQDPRLAAIDLRGRLGVLSVRATGLGGEPIKDPQAFVVPLSEGGDLRGFNLGSGVVELLTAGPMDFLVVTPTHRVARIEDATADCTVALQPAALARVRVTLPEPLPDGKRLTLKLQPETAFPPRATIQLDTGRGSGLDNFFEQAVPVADDGTVLVPVRLPGKHDVRGQIDRTYVYGFRPGTVELGAEGGEVEVALDGEALTQALTRLQGR